jgi:hypothetical protein
MAGSPPPLLCSFSTTNPALLNNIEIFMGALHLIGIKKKKSLYQPESGHVGEVGWGGAQKQNVAAESGIWSYATVSDKWQLLKY